jgi:hypothetical protein
MEDEKVIMYDSQEAATHRTDISGWVSRDGGFYADNEHLARWAGCTHMTCECGKPYIKGKVRCDECQSDEEWDFFVAVHEAAHTLLAITLGVTISHVYIGKSNGYVEIDDPRNIYYKAIVNVAGGVANWGVERLRNKKDLRKFERWFKSHPSFRGDRPTGRHYRVSGRKMSIQSAAKIATKMIIKHESRFNRLSMELRKPENKNREIQPHEIFKFANIIWFNSNSQGQWELADYKKGEKLCMLTVKEEDPYPETDIELHALLVKYGHSLIPPSKD